MSEKYVDLHIHTNYSDGAFSPAEIVEYAKKTNLAAISITDHDSVDGIDEALQAAQGSDIEIIPGIELSSSSTDSDGQITEMHILGYYIDYKSEKLNETLSVFRKTRLERAYEILKKLKENGVNLKDESFLKNVGKKSIGRLHFAKAMINESFAGSVQDAFQRYLAVNKPAYVPKYYMSAADAINLILSVGGIPVMAHPYYIHYTDKAMFKSLIDSGLKGIEAWHSKHPESAVRKFLALAEEFNLIATGGSDCHGTYKNEPPLIGRIKVPYSVVENLKRQITINN
ncbi:MAG: PHP domain-containing protein [Endomicrobia bacterium]|nr:PHP domain-containing protein [Endomicrobiia bacterium]MCL2799783.1 PHP domain-containing protein [Endomicrobiia bacterium]